MRALSLPLSIALAYLRNRKRQALVSILGVMMGVSFFIAIFAMMRGFQQYFVEKIIDVSPHVVMKDEYRNPPRQPIENAYPNTAIEIAGLKPKEDLRGLRAHQEILNALDQMPNLTYAPSLRAQAILRYGGRDVAATLSGISPEKERRVSTLDKDIIAGKIENLETYSDGIILGFGLAKKLGLRMGSRVSVISPSGVVLSMKVVGLFQTGITSLDQFEGYVLLKKNQILQKRANVINQIKIRLNDVQKSASFAAELERRFSYRTEGWEESNQNVFSIFVVQNGVMYSTIFAIVIVAAFGIFNIISTVVNEKVRDIAILKSMGFATHDIQKIFLYQGLIVGFIGALLGWLLGWILVEILAALPLKIEGDQTFVQTNGFILYRTPWAYVAAAFGALLMSSIAAVMPARKAAQVNPVDIIRGAA